MLITYQVGMMGRERAEEEKGIGKQYPPPLPIYTKF